MVREKDAVLIGLSGGPDSVALARGLVALRSRFRITIGLAHLNHMLRGEESERDEAFVNHLAKELNLPLFTEHQDIKKIAADTGTSLEDAGRSARYAFFEATATAFGYSKIALGHTWDDNGEQVLLSLIRGAGPTGLKGIPPRRGERIIRPLIQTQKSEILAFLDHMDQDYVLDSSNLTEQFLRNRVRNQLIPLLEQSYNPKIRDSLDRSGQIIREEDEFVQALAITALDGIQTEQTADSLSLSLEGLSALHPALVSRIIREAISRVKGDLKKISMTHIRDIRDFKDRSCPGKHLDLPDRIRVYLTRDHLKIKKEGLPLRTLGRRQKQDNKATGNSTN